MCMLVIMVITYCEGELSSCRIHSPRKSGQLVSAYPVTDFYSHWPYAV